MLSYLKSMNDLIMIGSSSAFKSVSLSQPAYSLSSFFPTCERNGVDQGIHNMLVRTPFMIPNLQLKSQHDQKATIVHMQSNILTSENPPQSSQSESQPDKKKKKRIVRNKGGELVSIVHQYDRDKELTSSLGLIIFLYKKLRSK